MTVFAHSQTTNKLVNEAANDSARLAGKIVKYRSLSEPIRLQDLEDSSRPPASLEKNKCTYSADPGISEKTRFGQHSIFNP